MKGNKSMTGYRGEGESSGITNQGGAGNPDGNGQNGVEEMVLDQVEISIFNKEE